MLRRVLLITTCGWTAVLSVEPTRAAEFAVEVISYAAGRVPNDRFTDPNSVLGSPDGVTGETTAFPNVLSPFSPAFGEDELTQIGAGGHLTLRLARPVVIGRGPEIGVIENAGMIDTDFPNGTAGDPVGIFSSDAGMVEVSLDGVTWVALNGGDPILFDRPAVFYTNAGPFDAAPPNDPQLADFGKPFTPAGGISALSGLTYPEIVTLMDGSGGGTWLDLDESGLEQVEFVRFSVAAGSATTLEIDAVLLSSAAVPEPATWLLLSLGAVLVFAARGRCRRAVASGSVLYTYRSLASRD
ncbi:MAG: PEP-CTERM sorting domain-containing protein, partial [Planctomycetes bacterium]|nr:PEP-CTERM sorting domain-containing protein [Planctomycetota bacterium]